MVKLDCRNFFLPPRFDQLDDQDIIKLNTMDYHLVYEGLQVMKTCPEMQYHKIKIAKEC